MQAQKTFLRSVVMVFSVVGVVACSSVKNDSVIEEETSEIKDLAQTNAAVYVCDRKPLSIYFHAEQAELTWNNQSHLLNHAVSASGSYYLGEELSFWIHGEKAELKINDMKDVECHLVRIDS